MRPINWKAHLIRLFLLAWGLQVLWLGWHFYPEAQDLVQRILEKKTGAAVRQEDPFYRWLMQLAKVMPPQAAYVFLDRYEAGKEIEARYHPFPRRHVLGLPHLPPSFLFYALRNHRAGFLVVHASKEPLSGEVKTAVGTVAFQPLTLPGPGRRSTSRMRRRPTRTSTTLYSGR